jgi:hypothetical protein
LSCILFGAAGAGGLFGAAAATAASKQKVGCGVRDCVSGCVHRIIHKVIYAWKFNVDSVNAGFRILLINIRDAFICVTALGFIRDEKRLLSEPFFAAIFEAWAQNTIKVKLDVAVIVDIWVISRVTLEPNFSIFDFVTLGCPHVGMCSTNQ